jgi:hypothetical protein
MEVIVALVVASVLSVGFLAAQNRSFYLLQDSVDRQKLLNISQKHIAENWPDKLVTPTGGRVRIQNTERDAPEAGWTLSTPRRDDTIIWYEMVVDMDISSVRWRWPVYSPRPQE